MLRYEKLQRERRVFFLCFRHELLYVRRGTTCHAELRSPVVPAVDDDHGGDGDADDGRVREAAEQEVPVRELQQRLQPQGRSDLPSEVRVRPGTAIQLPVLRLLRPAYLERASTRAKVPPRSGRVHGRPMQAAATRSLRPGVYPEDRRRPSPRRTTIREEQRRRMAPRHAEHRAKILLSKHRSWEER